MNPVEAMKLLANISLRDGREVTELSAAAWAADLPDVPLDVALQVLPTYYRSATRGTRNWAYPGDVLDLVREHYQQQRRELVEQTRARIAAEGGNGDDEHAAVIQVLREFNEGCPVRPALPAGSAAGSEGW